MKRIFAALAGIYLGTLLYAGIKLFVSRRNGVAAGVIGGADGPTSIMVSRSFDVGFFIAQVAVVLAVAGVFYLVRRRRNRK